MAFQVSINLGRQLAVNKCPMLTAVGTVNGSFRIQNDFTHLGLLSPKYPPAIYRLFFHASSRTAVDL
jgi:hypothetical protein